MAQNNERRFKIEDNQKMWDAYFNGSLEVWEKENRAVLEATEWTDEQKMKESAKMTAYKMSLDKSLRNMLENLSMILLQRILKSLV